MNIDPLKQVLFRADAAAGSLPGNSTELAERTRNQLQRQKAQKARTLNIAAALLLIIGIAITIRSFQSSPSTKVVITTRAPQPETVDDAHIQKEIAILRAQATAAERSVALMLEAEQRIRKSENRIRPDPRDFIRQQQDLAALTLVRQADRMYRELDRKQTATAAYQRVLELFPQTTWATVARQRLAEIKG